jgi:hypothetical protein
LAVNSVEEDAPGFRIDGQLRHPPLLAFRDGPGFRLAERLWTEPGVPLTKLEKFFLAGMGLSPDKFEPLIFWLRTQAEPLAGEVRHFLESQGVRWIRECPTPGDARFEIVRRVYRTVPEVLGVIESAVVGADGQLIIRGTIRAAVQDKPSSLDFLTWEQQALSDDMKQWGLTYRRAVYPNLKPTSAEEMFKELGVFIVHHKEAIDKDQQKTKAMSFAYFVQTILNVVADGADGQLKWQARQDRFKRAVTGYFPELGLKEERITVSEPLSGYKHICDGIGVARRTSDDRAGVIQCVLAPAYRYKEDPGIAKAIVLYFKD